mmetsp:Transcript_15920/g.17592  ORF Transcript_15920/g.17592 Transcript_15920/m.17592 type:complete len:403 (+) Transcript_15920:48-1256(+)
MMTPAIRTHRARSKILADLLAIPKRWASSPAGAGAGISGRSRFYQKVDIKPLAVVPWNSQQHANENVESPISAGVDGTRSASGIHHIPRKKTSDDSSLMRMLKPRHPGVEWDQDDDYVDYDDNDNNSNNNNPTEWYGVTLDGKSLSTPMGQTLAVPSETLAIMIAAEWDSQSKQGIQPSNMPLMTLACTTLDEAANHPKFYRDEALNYLRTDTTCFWADPTKDRLLHRRQQQAWKGLHEFCRHRLDGVSPTIAMGIEGILMCRKRGSIKPQAGLPHPKSLTEAATRWTHSLDAWQLVALNSIASQAKSFLIAFSILESNKINISQNKAHTSSNNNNNGNHYESVICPFPDMTQASEACRVEEEFQISNWGLVEGGHDYDRLNCSIQLQSANLFAKTILLENE